METIDKEQLDWAVRACETDEVVHTQVVAVDRLRNGFFELKMVILGGELAGCEFIASTYLKED